MSVRRTRVSRGKDSHRTWQPISCVCFCTECTRLSHDSCLVDITNSPYNDGVLVAAQVFASLAFLLSLTGITAVVLALVSVILFLSTCCCSMNKCGLVTSGVFGVLTGLVLILFAIAIPLNLQVNEDELRDMYGDKDYEAMYSQFKIRAALMLGGAALWMIAASLLFIFACSSRHQRVVQSYETVTAVVV